MKFVWNRAKKLRRRLERWTTALLFSAVQLASPHGSGAAPVLSSQRNRGRFSEIVYELAKLLTVLNPVPAVEELTAACLPAFDLGVPDAAAQVRAQCCGRHLRDNPVTSLGHSSCCRHSSSLKLKVRCCSRSSKICSKAGQRQCLLQEVNRPCARKGTP